MTNKTIKMLFLAVLIGFVSCTKSKKTEADDPLKYVDPFICTEGDNGQLYPGASYPF